VRIVVLVRILGNNEAAVRLGYKSAGALSEWMRRRAFRYRERRLAATS
jgi:hypothetical protein